MIPLHRIQLTTEFVFYPSECTACYYLILAFAPLLRPRGALSALLLVGVHRKQEAQLKMCKNEISLV